MLQNVPLHICPKSFPCIFKKYLCIYLAASGLDCVLQDLSLWWSDSVTVARGLHSVWDLRSLIRDGTLVLCIARQILHPWTTREVPFSLYFALSSKVRRIPPCPTPTPHPHPWPQDHSQSPRLCHQREDRRASTPLDIEPSRLSTSRLCKVVLEAGPLRAEPCKYRLFPFFPS